jgi:mono/diheme cytochrome c family protein
MGSMILDVTPPPGVQPTQQAASSTSGTGDISPLLPPDPVSGKEIYELECAPCHGATGMGEGPRAENLPSLPPPVGSLAYARTVPPTRWFQIITQGKIDTLMPGYGSSLSDRQRWDTVAYLMTLGTTSARIEEGLKVYRSNCQECHGSESISGYTFYIPELFHRSLDDLTAALTYSRDSMQHAGIDLSEDGKVNASLYLRTLLFAKPAGGMKNAVTPGEITGFTEDMVSISGQVLNGSGENLPAGLTVTLSGFDDRIVSFTRQTIVSDSGRFVFDGVPVRSGRTYVASTRYKNSDYSSPVIHTGQTDETENSRITIYEPDTDISRITAERVHIFFEFPRSDTIRVVQLYVLSNPTNRIITSDSPGGIVINYQIPAEVSNLQFQNGSLGQRFILTSEGIGDTQGIPPGDGTQILFSYDLPYRGDAGFSVTVPVAAQTVNVMLAAEGVNLKSRQLQEIGDKVVQDSTWRLFTTGNTAAGTSLNVQISGKPKVTTPGENEMSNSLAAGIISLVIVLVLIATYIFRDLMDRRTSGHDTGPSQVEPVDRNAILDAIIALDDQYQSGQIPAGAYQERRSELKSRLRRIAS